MWGYRKHRGRAEPHGPFFRYGVFPAPSRFRAGRNVRKLLATGYWSAGYILRSVTRLGSAARSKKSTILRMRRLRLHCGLRMPQPR